MFCPAETSTVCAYCQMSIHSNQKCRKCKQTFCRTCNPIERNGICLDCRTDADADATKTYEEQQTETGARWAT